MTKTIGGCTVFELQARMSPDEFEQWKVFYSLFPFDDMHRFHRPAAMVSTSMGGGDLQKRLDWLQREPSTSDMSDIDMSVMRMFGFSKKGG